MDGIWHKVLPPSPYRDNPRILSKEELTRLNITPLPCDLSLTTDAFSKDKVLIDAFGPQLARVIVAIRKEKYRIAKDMSFEEERILLLQRF